MERIQVPLPFDNQVIRSVPKFVHSTSHIAEEAQPNTL